MNNRDIERMIKRITKLEIKHEKEMAKLDVQCLVAMRTALNELKKDSFFRWYHSYGPVEYRRTYDLYRIIQIAIDKKKLRGEIDMNSDYLRAYHRVTYSLHEEGEEYLYYTSFYFGWHGGASGGPPDKLGRKFPGRRYDVESNKAGELYWRKPGKRTEKDPKKRYRYWGLHAVRQESPYERFMSKYEKVLDEVRKEYDRRYFRAMKEFDEILEAMKKELIQMIGRG